MIPADSGSSRRGGVLPEHSKRERNAGAEIGHVGARGTDKGDRDSRPSVSVSCLRERNKIV